MRQHDWRRNLGNGLIAAGVLLLLAAVGAWGWEQWQGKLLRDHLLAQPAVTILTPVADLTPTVAALARQPSPPAAPSPAPSPSPTIPATTVPVTATAPATETPPPATSVPPSEPVRLAIPDLKIDVPVTDMSWAVVSTASGPRSDWLIPANAAGRAVNSALLGEQGNMVISGHNNIEGRVFMPISLSWPDNGFKKIDAYTDRSEILDGRQIQLFDAAGRQYNYVVTAFYRLKDAGVPEAQREANARFIAPTGHTLLTLTTCWPPWSNTHRLVIVAAPAT